LNAKRARIIGRHVAEFCTEGARVPAAAWNQVYPKLYRRAKRYWSRHKKLLDLAPELEEIKRRL
jgi:hypothetical protein